MSSGQLLVRKSESESYTQSNVLGTLTDLTDIDTDTDTDTHTHTHHTHTHVISSRITCHFTDDVMIANTIAVWMCITIRFSFARTQTPADQKHRQTVCWEGRA